MRIAEVRTIALRSQGVPPPKGVGSVLVTPRSIFFEEQRDRLPGGPPIETLIVQVVTDDGLTGLGQVGAALGHARYTIDHHLRYCVIGADPWDVEVLWDRMFRESMNYGRKGMALEAISAIDIAIWDILGKAAGVPTYKLLGGRTRERIRCYASRLYATEDLDALAAEARAFVAEGFTMVKQRFGYGPRQGLPGMRRNLELIRTVRDAVGPDVEIAADAYMGWSPDYAIRMIRMLEDAGLDLSWVEEPLIPDDHEGYARVKAEVRTPISGGEHEFTRYGFRQLIERRSVDILQPDVNRCGGITEAQKIWALAAAHDLPVVPHAGQMHNHHLVMAHLNSPFAEYFPPPAADAPPDPNETFWRVFRGDPLHDGGFVTLNETPGLGIELNEETVARYRVP